MRARLVALLCLMVTATTGLYPQIARGSRTHWNKSRGFAPFRHATPEGIIINDTIGVPLSDSYKLNKPSTDCILKFAAANSHNHPAKSYPYRLSNGTRKKVNFPAWKFFIKGDGNDSLIVNVKTVEEDGVLSSAAKTIISAYHSSDILNRAEVVVDEGIDLYSGPNNWQLTLKDGEVRLSGGNRLLQPLIAMPVKIGSVTEFGFSACPGACLMVNDVTFSDNSLCESLNPSEWADSDHLTEYLATTKDPLEGYWVIFDRELEESLLQLGGDYRFAMVKDDENYVLIYLSGARINGKIWQPGMIKAILMPEPFPGIYNVVWFDAEGLSLTKDLKAQIGEGETLTIQFPYQNSSLRLRRLPQ